MGDTGAVNRGLSNATYQTEGTQFPGSAANLPPGWSIGGPDQLGPPDFFGDAGGQQSRSLGGAWGMSGQTPMGYDEFGPTSSGGTPAPSAFGDMRAMLGGNQPLDPDVLEFMGPSGRTHMGRETFDTMRGMGALPGGFSFPGGPLQPPEASPQDPNNPNPGPGLPPNNPSPGLPVPPTPGTPPNNPDPGPGLPPNNPLAFMFPAVAPPPLPNNRAPL